MISFPPAGSKRGCGLPLSLRPLQETEDTMSAVSEVFESKVETIPWSGCWIWMGPLMNNGYGVWQHQKVKMSAHRWSYTLYFGEIPEGMMVLHSCDTPICVNPAHLRIGTNSDNMKDAMQRGRFAWKNLQWSPTIPATDLDEIKRLRREKTLQEIADGYGVSRQAVHQFLKTHDVQ